MIQKKQNSKNKVSRKQKSATRFVSPTTAAKSNNTSRKTSSKLHPKLIEMIQDRLWQIEKKLPLAKQINQFTQTSYDNIMLRVENLDKFSRQSFKQAKKIVRTSTHSLWQKLNMPSKVDLGPLSENVQFIEKKLRKFARQFQRK